ncbi:23S rRNA (uracil(1939)-C(5))-methyltransferase RlmD [Ammonifex thiophilus]|uniref:23S rRNA (Uracil(1939)-C(5))-methyltransferase RlmD n=1 Tax=Ammonifex thiophilus TaxID=444093 RepID=A0A3D8P6G2_9THEO|nr:23S rRNA (uracil(1939)-C(5))-methyltransferase RlmD [Ammonifex thiophilus]RDV83944.1 23S rRNA (uracil(1939)-C(5))-methyltransferase RlmD [Ammonifex thiophilus]
MQLGQQIVLEITDLNHAGEGVGRFSGLVVFVPFALPGERVRARVTEIKKNYARARPEKILSPSPDRVLPPCPSFGSCGGCQLLHLDYEHQLRFKNEVVENALSRLGKLKEIEVKPIWGMENPWHYRNKVRLHVAWEGRKPILGLYAPSSHVIGHRVDQNACHLLDEQLNALARALARLMRKHAEAFVGLTAVSLRLAAGTGETMVVLEGDGNHVEWKQFIKELTAATSVSTVVKVRARRKEEVLYGKGYITALLDGLSFRFSALSFYQVNYVQTSKLYSKVLEYASLSGREQVVDAYCGVGTIALFLARKAARVVGIEISPEAVALASVNAAQNGLNHVSFIKGAAEEVLPELLEREGAFDLVVLDPPRQGVKWAALESLAKARIPRVIYVSCNPATLARDLSFLSAQGYRVEEVQPVDMFPHTFHIECVAYLCR